MERTIRADRRTAGRGHGPSVLAGIDDQARLSFPALRSVLVVGHGMLVVERYYHGATPATYFNVVSVTKSVTSALIGIALGDRSLGGLEQPIGRLLAEHLPQDPIRASAASPSSGCSP